MRKILLRARDVNNPNNPFSVNNFPTGGWRVRNNTNTGWIRMTPRNTKIRNPDHDPDTHAPDDPNYPLYLDLVE